MSHEIECATRRSASALLAAARFRRSQNQNQNDHTGMDITCLYTSFWEFICASGWVAASSLFGVDTDLRYYVIRDVIVL